MSATRIHHINFLVRDLDAAMSQYRASLGLAAFEVIDHAPRGARIARSKVGESWIVLVSPYDADSAPGQYLEAHGEGFFLLSLGVDDMEARLLADLDKTKEANLERRAGIADWSVVDLGEINGAHFQITDDID